MELMALRDLVKRPSNSVAPDRALYGDQYDIKIDALYDDLVAICDAVDGIVVGGSTPYNTDTGLSLWTTPVNGEVGYLSGNSSLGRAIATSLTTSQVWGVYNGTSGSVVVNGVVGILLEPGLTLNPNDRIYLSRTMAGRGTNVEPSTSGSISVFLGNLKSTTGYNSGSGSVQPVRFSPEDPVLID